MKNKIINNTLVNEVAYIIEETSNYIANRLTNNHLLKEGEVTLNEAKYFKRLAKEVLMEAAEELIPDKKVIEKPQENEENKENTIATHLSNNWGKYAAGTGAGLGLLYFNGGEWKIDNNGLSITKSGVLERIGDGADKAIHGNFKGLGYQANVAKHSLENTYNRLVNNNYTDDDAINDYAKEHNVSPQAAKIVNAIIRHDYQGMSQNEALALYDNINSYYGNNR